MLFNSFGYILIFLPGVLLFYFYLSAKVSFSVAKAFLVFASLCFYAYWKPIYVLVILGSALTNSVIATLIKPNQRRTLIFGIVLNLSLLAYFKYRHFFIDNINDIFDVSWSVSAILLPLGISFFTFTQIAYLVDLYKGKAKSSGLLNYLLFITYFPHLLAGPIIHHAQMMPQFADKHNKVINYENIYSGIILFSLGLFKKIVIADTFALFANSGYSHVETLTTVTAWITTLAYTLQIYFDFSGYTDMALGSSRMFNIALPNNFNSPYQATNIQDFWRRWHMTLSHFLRDYLYIPLGGNRVAEWRVILNLLVTFVIGGLWHGAGWGFVFWGFLHGSALALHRLFSKTAIHLPKWLGWFLTFNFINLTWIYFRANSFSDAATVIHKMLAVPVLSSVNPLMAIMLLTGLVICLKSPNSIKIANSRFSQQVMFIPAVVVILLMTFIVMEISDSHAFIYYQF